MAHVTIIGIVFDGLRPETMLKTRLYVECPNCRMQYLMKDFDLKYSNGAYIENVAGSPVMAATDLPVPTSNPLQI
jgi:hypothetical protein